MKNPLSWLMAAILIVAVLYIASSGIGNNPSEQIAGLSTNTPNAISGNVTPTVAPTLTANGTPSASATPNPTGTAVSQQVNTLRTQYNDNLDIIEGLESDIAGQQERITELKAESDDNLVEIDRLESEVETNTATIAGLEEENQQVLDQINELQAQIATNEGILDGLVLELNETDAQGLYENPTRFGVNWNSLMGRQLPQGTRLWIPEMTQYNLRVNQPGYYLVQIGKIPSYAGGIHIGTPVDVCGSVQFIMTFQLPRYQQSGSTIYYSEPQALRGGLQPSTRGEFYHQDTVNLIDPMASPVLVSESLLDGLSGTMDTDNANYQVRVFALMLVSENTRENWRIEYFCQ